MVKNSPTDTRAREIMEREHVPLNRARRTATAELAAEREARKAPTSGSESVHSVFNAGPIDQALRPVVAAAVGRVRRRRGLAPLVVMHGRRSMLRSSTERLAELLGNVGVITPAPLTVRVADQHGELDPAAISPEVGLVAFDQVSAAGAVNYSTVRDAESPVAVIWCESGMDSFNVLGPAGTLLDLPEPDAGDLESEFERQFRAEGSEVCSESALRLGKFIIRETHAASTPEGNLIDDVYTGKVVNTTLAYRDLRVLENPSATEEVIESDVRAAATELGMTGVDLDVSMPEPVGLDGIPAVQPGMSAAGLIDQHDGRGALPWSPSFRGGALQRIRLVDWQSRGASSAVLAAAQSILLAAARSAEPDDLWVYVVRWIDQDGRAGGRGDSQASDLSSVLGLPHVRAAATVGRNFDDLSSMELLVEDLDQQVRRMAAGSRQIILVVDLDQRARLYHEGTPLGTLIKRLYGLAKQVHGIWCSDFEPADAGATTELVFRSPGRQFPIGCTLPLVAGRCVNRADPTATMLIARPRWDGDIDPRTERQGTAAAIAELQAQSESVRLPDLPAHVSLDDLVVPPHSDGEAALSRLAIGVHGAQQEPYFLDLSAASRHVMIYGDPRSGLSTTLATIGETVRRRYPDVLVINLNGESSKAALEQGVDELLGAVKSGGEIVVLIDNYEMAFDPENSRTMPSMGWESRLKRLGEFLANKPKEAQRVHLVVACKQNRFKKLRGDALAGIAEARGQVLVHSAEQGSFDWSDRARGLQLKLPAGRIVTGGRNNVVTIQVAVASSE